VGKTAATTHLLFHLEEDAKRYDDLDLEIAFLNCDGLNTSYQVAVHLINELRDEPNQISTTGYPQGTVYEILWSELERTGGTTLLILDEIDNVEDDSILYQLPRARANNNLSQGKVGVIGISNDFSFRDNLSPKVKSSLCETELHFPAYDAKQLQAILRQREERAFRDAVIEPDVIPYCAADDAEAAADARQVIDLSTSAGKWEFMREPILLELQNRFDGERTISR